MRANEVEKAKAIERVKEYTKHHRDELNRKRRAYRAKKRAEIALYGEKVISKTVYDIDSDNLEHNEGFYLQAARRIVWDDKGKPWWRNWKKVAGAIDGKGYRSIKVSINHNKRAIRGHRLRWYQETGELVELLDHEDGDRDNNRLDNIGPATWSQNAQNCRKVKGRWSSDYYGVSKTKSQKFRAAFKGKTIGMYQYEIQAALAYDNKLEEVQDKFRVRNFRGKK